MGKILYKPVEVKCSDCAIKRGRNNNLTVLIECDSRYTGVVLLECHKAETAAGIPYFDLHTEKNTATVIWYIGRQYTLSEKESNHFKDH